MFSYLEKLSFNTVVLKRTNVQLKSSLLYTKKCASLVPGSMLVVHHNKLVHASSML